MKQKMPGWGIGIVSWSFVAWTWAAAHPVTEHEQMDLAAASAAAGGPSNAMTVSDAQALGPVIERALVRYFESRGVEFAPSGELAGLIADEIAGRAGPGSRAVPGASARYGDAADERATRGVFGADEVELTLTETGSGPSDFVQLVFDTPTATGSSAWNLAVSGADGTLFLSGPTFIDAFQVDPTNSKFRVANLEMPDLVRLLPKTTGSRPSCNGATSDDEGRLYYDSTDGLCYCDGSSWKKVDGGAAC